MSKENAQNAQPLGGWHLLCSSAVEFYGRAACLGAKTHERIS